MQRYLGIALLFLIITALTVSCGGAPTPPPAPAPTPTPGPAPAPTPTLSANTVGAVKTDAAPAVDGAVDAVWAKAKPISIQASGGQNLKNGTSTVELRALYTSDMIYFLAQWTDETESVRRAPWQKQADGSWKQLKDPNDKGGDNNLYYEDKFAFIWNINDSIAGFNDQGCMALCHPGEGKPFGNKYTAKEGELGDMWHWKGIRTGTVGQFDDQYVDSTRYDAAKSPEAGRKSDPKTAGGYSDNKAQDGKLPAFALPDNKPAPPYWILDSQKVAFDSSKYATNAEVPGIIVAPFTGDRGDLSAKGNWKDGKYILEWSRKLQTGSQYDVQFSTDKTYAFGVAVFDNAQVRHAFSGAASKLVFLK